MAAVLRFVRPDGTQGLIEAVNAEPHDANIRGAICAERAALCRFQKEEGDRGARVVRVVCVTDHELPIFPGPLCREFLTSCCAGDTEIIASGSRAPVALASKPLAELFPWPSLYKQKGQKEAVELGNALAAVVTPPAEPNWAQAYAAAAEEAKRQEHQKAVYPICFAAAASLPDGRVIVAQELKGIEYGCTVDAVSLLMTELLRAAKATPGGEFCIVQVDQFGVAHAPFAAARSLMIEHGLGHVLYRLHNPDGTWGQPVKAAEALPFADFAQIF